MFECLTDPYTDKGQIDFVGLKERDFKVLAQNGYGFATRCV